MDIFAIHIFTVKHGHDTKMDFSKKITIKILNTPLGGMKVFAFHIFGLNVCVHPWIN